MKLSSWVPFSCSIKSFKMVRRQYTALAAAPEGRVPCGRGAAGGQVLDGMRARVQGKIGCQAARCADKCRESSALWLRPLQTR